jgi:dephospho-CoA kinase
MTSSSIAPYVVGLTGGIGSGKSSASIMFERRGAYVIDTDVISRQLTETGGGALDAIAQYFPAVFEDGQLDRARLRSIVFRSLDKRRALEAILHPLIREESMLRLSRQPAGGAPYVLLVVPLLFESTFYSERVNCSVVMDVDEATQVSRVVESRGMDRAAVVNIVASQMTRLDRLLRAQFVVNNFGRPTALQPQVDRLHRVLCATASRFQYVGQLCKQK